MKHQPTVPAHLTPAPAEETHIHHHEDPTILAKWLRIGMEQGPIFWGGLAAVVAAIGAGVFFSSNRGSAASSGQEAWAELAAIGQNPADDLLPGLSSDVPTELRDLAEAHPNSAASAFARLQAGSLLLKDASGDLATTRRTDGIGKLMEADELFAEVLKSATNPTIKRIAALGAARSAEARLGLDLEDTNRPKPAEVIALYEKVAADFPGTPEADRAQKLATRLADPDCAAFYEALAKFDPNAASLLPSVPGAPSGSTLTDPLRPGASTSLEDLLNQSRPAPSPSDLPEPIDIQPPDSTPPAETPPGSPPTDPPASNPAPES